jgi:hypothetical protein
MPEFFSWFPQALVGTLLTLMGLLKLFGLAYGIEGGQGRPLSRRLCGT